MTHLILLGGPPGVGKTSALKELEPLLQSSGILDADDAWRVSPDISTSENRLKSQMIMVGTLQGYLDAGCQNILLAWVFARSLLYQPIIDALRENVDEITQLYLVAEPDDLRARITERAKINGTTENLDARIAYSLDRLEKINQLPFARINTSNQTPSSVASMIAKYIT